MTTIFKVRRSVTHGKYVSYKYLNSGYDWSFSEIEECSKIIFIFSKNLTQDEKDKINSKWKHKL